MTIVRPETIVRWHRARNPHLLALEVSATTRQAQGGPRSSAADPRDELGKSFLGRSFAFMENSSSSALMSARLRLPSTWPDTGAHHRRAGERSSLNHANGIASIDLFVVPTISFRFLYELLILRH